jgi:ComF family protein
MRNVIREIKFNWRWRGANQLGELCEASKLKPEDYDKTTPIPFHFIRRFVRYVQPVSVITETFKQRGFICEKTLARTVHTEYQSKLSRSERRLNVKGAFEINKDVNGMRILIIDDVITTGATVTEAARTLKKNGAAWVDVYTLLTGVPR